MRHTSSLPSANATTAFSMAPRMRVDGLAEARNVRRLDRYDRPPHDIAGYGRQLHDLAAFHRNQGSPLGSGLPYVAPLQVPGEDDVGSLMKHCGLMHVAQRPVVVALVDQIGEGARRVVVMAAHAAEPRVQDADVERSGDGLRISQGQIVDDGALPEALPVEDDAQIVDSRGFGSSRSEDMDVVRQGQAAGDLALGIMVAMEQVDRNAGLVETAHLADEVQAGVVVAPVTVVEIARDDEKGHLLFDGNSNELIERFPRSRADALRDASLLPGKPFQRTVEVNVRSVKGNETTSRPTRSVASVRDRSGCVPPPERSGHEANGVHCVGMR